MYRCHVTKCIFTLNYYCIVLYCIVLYCIVLYCIVLYVPLAFVFICKHFVVFLLFLWRVLQFVDVFLFLLFIFSYFTCIVQLLCSLSGWLHLNCSAIGTGFNGAETNCGIAHGLGILLMNSNCFAIHLQRHI